MVRGKAVLVIMLLAIAAAVGSTEAGAQTTAPGHRLLLTELKAALRNAPGTYGLHYIDLGTGAEYGLNEGETFHAASTFKVPLNFYLGTKIAAGEADPNRYLTYMEKHHEGGTGHLQHEKFGTRFRIAALARDSIVSSDNVATNMLLDHLGYANVKNFMRAQGAAAVNDRQNTTCPRDMAYIIRGLVRFADRHPAQGGTVLRHMRTSIFREGIPAAVPTGITVANKTGYWPPAGTYNDIAYVEHPQRPYILTIYSKNTPGHATAFAKIRELTRIVHAFHETAVRQVELEWDGRRPALAEPALLYAGTVEVPVRALVNALPELGLTWEAGNKTLVVHSRATAQKAVFRPGDGSYRIADHRTYLPLRTLAEALGYKVEWDAAKVLITPTRRPSSPGTAGPDTGLKT